MFFLNYRTNWNRYCSATLRRLLPKLEETKSGGSHHNNVPGSIESAAAAAGMSTHSGSVTNLNEEHLLELREVMTSYQVNNNRNLLTKN